jgi:hypothetical protein
VEHFEDRDMANPTGMVYWDKTLYVVDKSTIRTYDSETGEFLEVWASKDGMEATYAILHDM